MKYAYYKVIDFFNYKILKKKKSKTEVLYKLDSGMYLSNIRTHQKTIDDIRERILSSDDKWDIVKDLDKDLLYLPYMDNVREIYDIIETLKWIKAIVIKYYY